MKILHPYTRLRPLDEQPTWDFLDTLRRNYHIIDWPMGVENRYPRDAYVEFIKMFWGTDDLIILEDDKLPTLEDFAELVFCKERFCAFPYPMLNQTETDMDYWREYTPFTLGFVKFSKELQLEYPASRWRPDVPNPKVYPFAPADMMIEANLGAYHLHDRPIKHNHRRAM